MAPRRERGWRNRLSNIVTLGAPVENTVPAEPSAQATGIELGSVRKESQSGNGTAPPTHAIVCVDAGRPVALITGAMSRAGAMFWNIPTPAWITAWGGRADPGA